jgi:phage repressor protein C with HTH and peptisase S24 domain
MLTMSFMDKYETRRNLLQRLVDSFGRGGQRQVADKIGVEANYISRLLYPEGKSGKKRIGEDVWDKIVDAFPNFPSDVNSTQPNENAPASSLRPAFSRRAIEINTDDTDDYVTVSRVDLKLSAGITGYQIEPLNGDLAPIIFRKDWMEKYGYVPGKVFALKVSGRSMEPSLYENDLVVVNTLDTKPSDGDVFAVNYEGELVIKRLVREAGNWYLSSDNPDKVRFGNKLCHEECLIIGRIIYKQSERI